jgi:hypothetical protein
MLYNVLLVNNIVSSPRHEFSFIFGKASLSTGLRTWPRSGGSSAHAIDLCLSLGTVRNYLSSAIGKIGARNRLDAIRIANRSGWPWTLPSVIRQWPATMAL